MMKTRSESPYARLNFRDGEVIVTPQDYDVFTISAERAVEACRAAVDREQRIERFKSDLLVPIFLWCEAHADRVQACYVPRPGILLQVFVVTTSPRFDFRLADELATLELGLARAGWRVGALQLPQTTEASLATFFDPKGALEIYAHRGPAPQEG